MRFLALLSLVFFMPTAAASEVPGVRTLADGATSPPASINDLAWLAGTWTGEGLGGAAEEVISTPAGGQMMGMFRLLKADGSANFYEFYLFSEQDDTLVLRLKHFSPKLIGWEEKDGFVEFPLVAIEGQTAFFDGITYALTAPGELQVVVNVSEAGEVAFSYRREK